MKPSLDVMHKDTNVKKSKFGIPMTENICGTQSTSFQSKQARFIRTAQLRKTDDGALDKNIPKLLFPEIRIKTDAYI